MKSTYVAFTGPGQVEMKAEEISADGLEPMQVVIRNEASIISAGTELASLHNIERVTSYPKKSGYGSVGIIEAKGDGIDDFNVGDRVFYAGKHASVQQFRHGGDNQWQYLFPVPDGLDPVYAAAGCMAQIAISAPHVTNLRIGDTVAVFGLGTVGNLAAQMYAIQGARVIGVDPVARRCETARKTGIAETVDAPPDKQVEAVLELTGGRGADVTVDAAGHSAVIAHCVKATALFGQILLLGSPRAEHICNATELLRDVHTNSKTIRGAHMWQFPVRHVRESYFSVEWNFAAVFELIRSGKLNVRDLISHVIRPDEAPAAYDGLMNKRDEYTGVIIQWS